MRITEEDIKKQESNTSNPDISEETSNDNPFEEDSLATAGMSFKEKQHYKKELLNKRLATMNKEEKRAYLIQYYKGHFIFGLCLILFLCFTVRFIYKASIPVDLTVMIANDAIASPSDYITKTVQTYNNLDPKHKITISTGLILEETEADYDRDGMISRQKLWASIENDEVDILIGDSQCLNYVSSSGDITEIDKNIDKDLYDKIKDRCITAADKNKAINNGEPFIAAIDISDTEFAKNCGLSYDTVYLMLPANRYQNNDASIMLIKTIFGL